MVPGIAATVVEYILYLTETVATFVRELWEAIVLGRALEREYGAS